MKQLGVASNVCTILGLILATFIAFRGSILSLNANTVALIVLACFLLGASVFQLLAIRRAAGPSVKILSPLPDRIVDFHHTVYGSVSPPNNPVQVRVFTRGDWHLQARAEVVDGSWRCVCQFGHPESVNQSHKLVALFGEQTSELRIRDLPKDATRSEIISVHRNA